MYYKLMLLFHFWGGREKGREEGREGGRDEGREGEKSQKAERESLLSIWNHVEFLQWRHLT
jgi:hypothetical protein